MRLLLYAALILSLALLHASFHQRPLPAPRCARCRHSLAGLEPHDAPRCPECGRSLARSRAVATSAPAFRPSLLIPALLLLALVLTLAIRYAHP